MTLTTGVDMQTIVQNGIRRARVIARKFAGREPKIALDSRVSLEAHGSEYGGWCIPANRLTNASIVVDVGLGEDISFSTSLIDRYGLTVHGFDPTPRSIAYVDGLSRIRPAQIWHRQAYVERDVLLAK